jgi:hypothetical protein
MYQRILIVTVILFECRTNVATLSAEQRFLIRNNINVKWLFHNGVCIFTLRNRYGNCEEI